jgi:hypothetical protein
MTMFDPTKCEPIPLLLKSKASSSKLQEEEEDEVVFTQTKKSSPAKIPLIKPSVKPSIKPVTPEEPAKRKRGRPRKFQVDLSVKKTPVAPKKKKMESKEDEVSPKKKKKKNLESTEEDEEVTKTPTTLARVAPKVIKDDDSPDQSDELPE